MGTNTIASIFLLFVLHTGRVGGRSPLLALGVDGGIASGELEGLLAQS
ncbi:MAG TPA: hypothetical protein VEX68_11365 [Bryobacteraceae bacterium]|nr:hypothetical protein [Bryobacteraceae bacterium]